MKNSNLKPLVDTRIAVFIESTPVDVPDQRRIPDAFHRTKSATKGHEKQVESATGDECEGLCTKRRWTHDPLSTKSGATICGEGADPFMCKAMRGQSAAAANENGERVAPLPSSPAPLEDGRPALPINGV